MSNKSFIITDIVGYCNRIRTEAAKAITEDYYMDDLDKYITLDQVKKLVHSNALNFVNDNPVIDENTNQKLFEEAVLWIHNSAQISLAAKGELECAWDDEKNEMVFWRPNNESATNNSKEKG
jgi:hypothetical protein